MITAVSNTRLCPVCDVHDVVELYRPKPSPGPISRCQSCDMVFVSRFDDKSALIFDGPVVFEETSDPHILTSDNLDDVAGNWELDMLPSKLNEAPALRENSIEALNLMQRHEIRSGRKILDFGSGFGFFLAVAKEMGWDAHGLEPLPASSVYARAEHGLNILTDTLREDSYPPESFDAITAFQVFEHLPTPKHDLRILHSILRQDGLLLIEVPNFDTWTMRLMKERHRHFVPDHLNLFSAETLGQLLESTGFEVIESFYPKRRMSVRHLVVVWLARMLPKSIANAIRARLEKTSLWNRIIGVSIGDILTVVARKA